MESEEVLTAIMSKLKEYKANPLSSPVEAKDRQKNLMKMFCIYTSLKKREKTKQKKHNDKQSIENEFNDIDNCKQKSEIDSSKRMSSNSLPENVDTNKIKSEDDMLMEFSNNEPSELGSDFSPKNGEIITTEIIFDKAGKSFDKNVEEHENSLNQFLIQLSERLKRLPYRQRSKLELEFFRRLVEVEECLES